MKLFDFEARWVAAGYGAVFPENTSLPHGIARLGPAAFFAEVIGKSPLEQAVGLRVALWIVALAPIFVLRRLATIASETLTQRDRELVLDRLLSSPAYAVRQLVAGWKAVGSMLYATSPEARAAMTIPNTSSFVESRSSGLVAIRRSAGSTSEIVSGGRHAA